MFHLFFMMVGVVNAPIFEVNIMLTSTRHIWLRPPEE